MKRILFISEVLKKILESLFLFIRGIGKKYIKNLCEDLADYIFTIIDLNFILLLLLFHGIDCFVSCLLCRIKKKKNKRPNFSFHVIQSIKS